MADAAIAPPAASPGAARTGWRPLAMDLLLVVVLVAVAAAIRLPQAQIVPPYTDETEEALRAWRVVEDGFRPLVNVDAYIGALWTYVVAGAFAVFGRSPDVPRLASLAAGALTVGATFLLGRRLLGPTLGPTAAATGGLVAALLLAANATHVLVNSHVAWSNCVTPLFTTVAFWLLARALDHPTRPLGLGLAGLAFGLALQTHPSVAALLVGALAYALIRDPRLPLRPGAWLAAVLFVVGYANVLAYNLGSGFDTLTQAQRVGSEYAGGAGLDSWGYVASVLGILVLIVQVTAGVVEPRLTAAEYLLDPRVAVTLAATIAALAWSMYRRQWLLLCVAVPAVVLIPALNQRWSPILASRYIMPIVPLVLVMVAGLLVSLAGRRLAPNLASAASVGVAALVGMVQLGGLWAYYGTEIAAGRSNDGPRRMVQLVDETRRSREPFVVHPDLHLLPTGGGGTWAKAVDFLLELEGVRKDVAPREDGATLRACNVTGVTLRYVERDERRRPARDEPRYETYWIARQYPLPRERRADAGEARLTVPYSLPWRNRSLFDPRAPTFDTGCE